MCDLFDKAEAKGLASLIKVIRKKMQKNFSAEETADVLEQKQTDIVEVYDLIQKNPELSDREIAKIVLDKKDNGIVF